MVKKSNLKKAISMVMAASIIFGQSDFIYANAATQSDSIQDSRIR